MKKIRIGVKKIKGEAKLNRETKFKKDKEQRYIRNIGNFEKKAVAEKQAEVDVYTFKEEGNLEGRNQDYSKRIPGSQIISYFRHDLLKRFTNARFVTRKIAITIQRGHSLVSKKTSKLISNYITAPLVW